MKMINAKEWNKGRLKAEQVKVKNLTAEPLTWVNQPTESLISEKYLNKMLEGSIVTSYPSSSLHSIETAIAEKEPLAYKPLICKCCGAPINRDTMTCEYCGTQYGKG